MLKAYKVELDPNDKQITALRRCAGSARFVYNWALADRKAKYEAGTPTGLYEQKKRFNALKKAEYPWLSEIPYATQESAFANLDTAYQNFFRRVKNGETPGFPRFKKRGDAASFQLRNTKIERDRVRLTGIGWVRIKERRYLPVGGDYGIYVTLSERAGRWFVSVLVEEPDLAPLPGDGSLGVDVGIHHLAVCSDGAVFDNPKALRKYDTQLRRLQKELSRRAKGSENWKNTRAKIASLYAKIANVRGHALHQVSHYAAYDSGAQTVVVEDLNVCGMMKNHHLAAAIADASPAELRRQIGYKTGWVGREMIEADRWFASSKTCSRCGCIKSDLTLADRTFTCLDCGLEIDRDLNAARNLAALVKGQTDPDCLGSWGEVRPHCEPETRQAIEP